MAEREEKGERIDDTKTAIPTFRPCMVYACLIWGYHVRTSYGGLPVLRFCTRLRIDQEKIAKRGTANRPNGVRHERNSCHNFEGVIVQFKKRWTMLNGS